jgi:hypothetical protein
MAFGELLVAFGRVVATSLEGAANSILADIRVLEDEAEAPDDFDSSELEALLLPPGFYCRPLGPNFAGPGVEAEGECEVVALRAGDELVPVGYRDLRINAKTNPDEGELGLAHYAGGFLSFKLTGDADGTAVALYSPRGSDGAHVISMDPDASNSHVVILHEAGQSITLNADGQVVIVSPDGANVIEVGDDSVKVNGAEVRMVGSVVLGTETDPTVDLDVQALAKEDELDTWIGEVNSAIADLKTALTTIVAPTGGGACTVTDTSTAPTAVPEYTTNVVAK